MNAPRDTPTIKVGDRTITLGDMDWVEVRSPNGGTLKQQSVQCVLLFAILEQLISMDYRLDSIDRNTS